MLRSMLDSGTWTNGMSPVCIVQHDLQFRGNRRIRFVIHAHVTNKESTQKAHTNSRIRKTQSHVYSTIRLL